MKKYTVFDNEGETLDRYTVINRDGDMIGLSANPNSPLGFNQYCGNCVDHYMNISFGYSWRRHCDVKKVIKNELPRIIREFKESCNLGKEMPFKSLSKELQETIIKRFEG